MGMQNTPVLQHIADLGVTLLLFTIAFLTTRDIVRQRQMFREELRGKGELLAHTLWSRRIKANGQKYGVPSGFPKPLRKALGPWTQRHGVQAKGMG